MIICFLVGVIYFLIQTSLLLATGEGWTKFWLLDHIENFQYWDASIYAQLAVNPACSAFYPLWPSLVRVLTNPDTVEEALKVMIVTSEILFLASLPLARLTFDRIIKNTNVSRLVFILYALGPNAIFHSIGYTESLFSLLSLLFLLSLHTAEQKEISPVKTLSLYGAIFVLSVLLNLLRPVLLQSWFAITFILIILSIIRRISSSNGDDLPLTANTTPLTILIGIGSIVGYSIYGFFCLNTAGNFLAPFQAQQSWGRTIAFRPWLLVFPRSLLMDIHALYTSILVFAILGYLLYAIYRGWREIVINLPSKPWIYIFLFHPLFFIAILTGLSYFAKDWIKSILIHHPRQVLNNWTSFTVLYAVAFSGVHCIINFLANSGYLYSNARHYFGTPYAFVSIGVMLTSLSVPKLNRLMWVIAAVGVVWLGSQWFNYGSGGWLG